MNKADENEKQSDDFVNEVETAFLWVSKIIAIVLFGVGLSILIYQLWIIFDTNTWQSLSIVSMLVYVDLEWAKSPDSILFVHKLLNVIPLFLFFIVLAVVQYLSGLIFAKKIKEAIKAIGLKDTNL